MKMTNKNNLKFLTNIKNKCQPFVRKFRLFFKNKKKKIIINFVQFKLDYLPVCKKYLLKIKIFLEFLYKKTEPTFKKVVFFLVFDILLPLGKKLINNLVIFYKYIRPIIMKRIISIIISLDLYIKAFLHSKIMLRLLNYMFIRRFTHICILTFIYSFVWFFFNFSAAVLIYYQDSLFQVFYRFFEINYFFFIFFFPFAVLQVNIVERLDIADIEEEIDYVKSYLLFEFYNVVYASSLLFEVYDEIEKRHAYEYTKEKAFLEGLIDSSEYVTDSDKIIIKKYTIILREEIKRDRYLKRITPYRNFIVYDITPDDSELDPKTPLLQL